MTPGPHDGQGPPSNAARQLSRPALDANTASASLAALGLAGLSALCREHTSAHAPERELGHEPRAGFPIVYSESRARRMALAESLCVVCDGLTCPAADVVDLPGGDAAWLTPNLYPIVYPFDDGSLDGRPGAEVAGSQGVHLVHWSSRRHDGGWPGADAATATALLEQLARTEEFLLHAAGPAYPDVGHDHRGHVGIIKNRGRRVGGSVEHDHQQIMLSAARPAEPQASGDLAPRLLAHADPALVVDRVDGRVTTLVAPFMRRPLHAFIAPHGDAVGWLHHLSEDVLSSLAVAIARLTAATSALMTERQGEPAWNLAWHTGSGAHPLLELRPFTQPLGGYEHLGIYLCEERPATSAARLRAALAGC